MHGRTRVLIIDDEFKTLEILGMRLRQDGFEVTTATTGEMGLKLAYETHPDAILLDVIMPGMDGLKVCRRLREVTDAVIMFVTVKGGSEDVIRGLHMGADDYVVKPYNYMELLARLYACLRRRADAKLPPIRLQRGEAVLITDPSRRLVFINDGRSVRLTPKEFELLRYLVKNRGRVLSADTILTNVWGAEYKGERDLVKQFVYRLRNKLEMDPSKPEYIVTVRGSGYSFEEDTRPRGLKKSVSTPPRPAEVPKPLQSVKPLIVPEGQEPMSWAAKALPSELASRKSHRVDDKAQAPKRKKRRIWIRRAAVALFLAFLIPLGTAFAAGYALPGDTLYPVKTLLEDVQHSVTLDEVSHAQLHLRFAERRLEEVVSLLNQGRYEDIPAAMARFESEMRDATWVLVNIAGDEAGNVWALETFLDESVESHTEALDSLMENVPSGARPALDQAIDVLELESTHLRTLLTELLPAPTPQEMAEEGSTNPPVESTPEKPSQNEPPEVSGASETEPVSTSSINASVDSSSTAYVEISGAGVDATPPAVTTPKSLPPLISTMKAIQTIFATSHVEPTATPTPTHFHYPLP